MFAEIVAIGDELVTGQRLDTNSPWLSQQLAELGITTQFYTTVGDDLEANLRAFRTAIERSDIVLATGGLGPTGDDLTREALAFVTGRPLVVHEPSLRHIQQLFLARGRSMPERNRVQALFPQGAEPIPNADGTAPGIYLRVERMSTTPSHVFALPGVPAEMKAMWQQWVRTRLMELYPNRPVVCRRVLKCFGVGESELEAKLPDLIRRGEQPRVGITVSQASISLRIQAEAGTAEECQQQLDRTEQIIRHCLGTLVFGNGEDYELQHAVTGLLRARGENVAVAEVGTQGRVAHWLTEADIQRPPVFSGAWVLHFARQSDQEAETHEQASQRWVEEMSSAVRRHFGAYWGLAIGPWPEELGITPNHHIFFALSSPSGVVVQSASTAGHPDVVRSRAAKQALNFLRLQLLGVDPSTAAAPGRGGPPPTPES